jgi:hypothetical protein
MKSILSTSLIVIQLTGFYGCALKRQAPGVLELRAITTEVLIPSDKDSKLGPCLGSCQEISYRLVNNTDHNLLLYDFRRNFHFGKYEQGLTCDTVWNIFGKSIYLFTKDLKFKAPSPGIHDSATVTFYSMERQVSMAKTWYRNSRVFLRSGESLEFKTLVDFRDYDLVPDTFYLKLAYMHIGVHSELTKEELRSDLDNAELYNGCLWSDLIRVVVGPQ